ncbi:MAG: Uma2 family endonuclease [Chloroflexi bacterium AL-W]|nr:Uma2 family endonuclease [Chloroflexi bacterium AL-N1]NOK66047.1 Uma2 family endonuclease [Chloroflexi bacterium AL-N10]NOK72928.1 Uma2 family endonuclease [Chloroflexi bacterium AL-N5]NOK79825.1 Uma2 family endonuclease [Chloroflexi bacterium AL-W]NOK88319.1 Uma2 family endonuclease [Chloroflexi bacterium AL-N15]
MTTPPEQWITAEDDFVLDQQSDSKLAYYDGIIVAQAGSTAHYNLIVTNLIGHVYPQTQQNGCRIFPGDMRVQAIDQRIYTYPDLTIVCATPPYTEPNEMTLINPTVIIESLSPSTETHDRKETFLYYRTSTSLQEYILIAQHTPYVQRHTCQTPRFWHIHLADLIVDQITLETIGCTIRLHTYTGIDFSDS